MHSVYVEQLEKIFAPVLFSSLHLAAAIADYMAAYPDVAVDLTLNYRIVDLVEEGYDVAVDLIKSQLLEDLAHVRWSLCAVLLGKL